MEEKKISLDTMLGVGKKKQIAGREYTILPVNICDMHYIMGEENKEDKLVILDKKALEKEDEVKYLTEVIAEKVTFLSSKKQEEAE